MRKKILFYTMAMIKGGTERTIANLTNHFIKDYDITIVTNINYKVEYNLNKKIKVIALDKKNKQKEILPLKIITKLSSKRTQELKKIINKENPNLIITFLPEPTIRALSLKNNIPIITAIRNRPNSEFKGILKLLRNHYYKYSNTIIVQDNNFKKYLPNNLNIITIPNYLSDEFLKTNKQKKEKIIISVSRLEKQKNQKLLINSFSKLNKKFNDYKLLIYGKGSKQKSLEKLIKRKKLTGRVFIKEPVDNIAKVLNKASLFVLPSNYEGMPNILLEAMSQNLPVISTNSSEAIKTLINNKNGIIVKKNNQKELTNKIEYLLENKEISQKLANEALKVKETYTKKQIINKWQQTINKYIE